MRSQYNSDHIKLVNKRTNDTTNIIPVIINGGDEDIFLQGSELLVAVAVEGILSKKFSTLPTHYNHLKNF